MGSPLVIPDAPGAAIIGGGFIGPGARRGAAADRRRGRRAARVFARTRLRRGPPAGDPSRLPRPRRAPGRRARGRRPHRLAEFAALRAGSPVLESGRHVVCEKPLASTSEETAALRALAESRPAQAAAVNYNIRYYPLCREIRERIAAGGAGRVLSVTGSYVQDWLLYPDDYNWRVEADGRTNLRAVADIGTHWMDLAQYLIGLPIRSVNADLATFHPRRMQAHGADGDVHRLGGRRARGPRPSRRWTSPPTITRRSCCGSTRASGVRSTSRRSPPAARTG